MTLNSTNFIHCFKYFLQNITSRWIVFLSKEKNDKTISFLLYFNTNTIYRPCCTLDELHHKILLSETIHISLKSWTVMLAQNMSALVHLKTVQYLSHIWNLSAIQIIPPYVTLPSSNGYHKNKIEIYSTKDYRIDLLRYVQLFKVPRQAFWIFKCMSLFFSAYAYLL